MKILVTGGAGFIGSHLVRRLLAEGYEVVVLDNLSNGKVENLPQHPELALHVGDILSDTDLTNAVDGCPWIVHLAAEPSVQKSVEAPVSTHEVNYVGTLRLVNSAAKLGAERLVFASSAAVYGASDQLPVRETTRLRPLNQYALDKLASEYLLESYSDRLRTTALRFFNIYGERQDPKSPYSGVVSIFQDRLRRALPIHIYGDGGQSRDFIYVGDIIDAIVASLRRETGTFVACNVATGKGTTILALLDQMAEVLGAKYETIFEPGRSGEIRESRADVSLMSETLGISAKTSLRDGLTNLCAPL